MKTDCEACANPSPHGQHTCEAKCPECSGRTIDFAGYGTGMQYRICSLWREPGHLSETQINERLYRVRYAVRPSGRFA